MDPLDRPVTHRDVQRGRQQAMLVFLGIVVVAVIGWFLVQTGESSREHLRKTLEREDREAAAREAKAREIREANERAEAERRRDEYR